MNHPHPSNKTLAIDPREWDAQERARAHAARGSRAGLDDPLAARYGDVAVALRASAGEPPSDFAVQVAALAQRQGVAREAFDARLERNLLRALVGVLALAGAIAVGWYGPAAWRSLVAWMPASHGAGIGWAWPLAGCLLASWALGAVRKVQPRWR